ncbi:MAG: hypothetical protein O3B47_02660 [bacterium]|nr:hypothetical protein [bacterium]
MGPETPDKSNLSPTASFVAGREGIVTNFLTPELEKRKLIGRSNEVIRGILEGTLEIDSADTINLASDLTDLKSYVTIQVEKAKAEGKPIEDLSKALAVVDNYTQKLIATIRTSDQYRKQAPPESAAA